MIYEAVWSDEDERAAKDATRGASLAVLSVATGIVAFIYTAASLHLGRRFGALFGKRMEILGGVILIGIGAKNLVDHLPWRGRRRPGARSVVVSRSSSGLAVAARAHRAERKVDDRSRLVLTSVGIVLSRNRTRLGGAGSVGGVDQMVAGEHQHFEGKYRHRSE